MFSILTPSRRRTATAENAPEQPGASARTAAPVPPAPTPAAAASTPAPTPVAATQVEQPSAPRFPAEAVPSITGLRISPRGVEAKLVNISTTGLLAECGDRLQTGSAVTVIFEGTFKPDRVRGTVVRNAVSSVGANGTLRYHIGISFATPLEIGAPQEANAAAEPEPKVEPQPVAPESPPAVVTPTERIIRNRW